MPTVTNTLKAPDGTLVSTASVQIELAGTDGVPIKGYVTAGDYSFIGYHQPTVTAGVWSVVLVANTLINPAGTRWKVSETHNSRTHIYYLSVPDGAGPYFVEDILSDAPGAVTNTAYVPQEGQVIGGPTMLTGNVATKVATSPGTPHSGSSTAINTAALNPPSGFKAQAKLLARVDRGAVTQTVTVVLYNNTDAANAISVTSASGTGGVTVESAWTDMPSPAALKEYHLVSYASAANAFAVNSAYLLFRLVAS